MNPAFSDGAVGLERGSKLARQVWGLQPGRLARSLFFLGGPWGRWLVGLPWVSELSVTRQASQWGCRRGCGDAVQPVVMSSCLSRAGATGQGAWGLRGTLCDDAIAVPGSAAVPGWWKAHWPGWGVGLSDWTRSECIQCVYACACLCAFVLACMHSCVCAFARACTSNGRASRWLNGQRPQASGTSLSMRRLNILGCRRLAQRKV